MNKISNPIFGLKLLDVERITKIFSNFRAIEKALVFGSRATGKYKPYSDIDIVLFGSEINLTLQNKIEDQLDDLLLPYKFDVSVFEKIDNADLIDHIERVGIEIYSRH